MEASKATVLKVDGMTCRSCVRHVEQALRGVDGVTAVEVQFREGQVVVQHDGGAPSALLDELLIGALRDAGYESRRAA